MNVAHRHGRSLSRRFLHYYSQEDGVNKAPSAPCGNFRINSVCVCVDIFGNAREAWARPKLEQRLVEEAGDTELCATENM